MATETNPAILSHPACSRMRLFVLCAHHECPDCVPREHRVNELKKRESLPYSTREACVCLRFVYRHTLTFKGKKSPPSVFPELIQLCGSFSPVLGCVDKELVLFSCSDKEAQLYLGTTSTFSTVNRSFWALLRTKSRPSKPFCDRNTLG